MCGGVASGSYRKVRRLMHDIIHIGWPRLHKLKHIGANIPEGELVCVTSLSASGRSTLVFDTLHAEGQRHFREAFRKSEVDRIEGLSRSIAVGQHLANRNPRCGYRQGGVQGGPIVVEH